MHRNIVLPAFSNVCLVQEINIHLIDKQLNFLFEFDMPPKSKHLAVKSGSNLLKNS